MKKQLIILILANAAIFTGCDLKNRIESTLDTEITNAFSSIQKVQELQKDTLLNLYSNLITKSMDSAKTKNIKILNLSVLQTSTYIDSIISEMNHLDYKNPNNIGFVKITFVYKGAGDSLYNRLHQVFDIAEKTTGNSKVSELLINARNNLLFHDDVGKFKTTYFETTGSLGTTMILYSFKTEILRTGIESMASNN